MFSMTKSILLACLLTSIAGLPAHAQSASPSGQEPQLHAADAYKVLMMVIGAAEACNIASVDELKLYQQRGFTVLSHEERVKFGNDAERSFHVQRVQIERDGVALGKTTATSDPSACPTTIAETYIKEKAFIDAKTAEFNQ